MRFEYEQSQVLESTINSIIETTATSCHSLEQQFANNILNQIEYLLIQRIIAISKTDHTQILNLSIAYKYLIVDVDSASSSLIEAIILDSYDRFNNDYLEFVEGHFLSKVQVELEYDADIYIKPFNEFISSLQN